MLMLHSCGCHTIHDDGIVRNRPNGSGNYTFVFFKSSAELKLHNDRFSVEKNSFILFQPATPHLYRELESPFINDWFHCSGIELDSFLTQIQFPVDKIMRASDPLLISRFIRELQHTFRFGGTLRDAIIDCELRAFFMKLSDLQQRTAPEKLSRYYIPFTELRNELYRSPPSDVSVAELAARLNMSKSYFQHIYKDLFHCSVMADVIHARLEHAKYLLEHSELSVAHIASLCGYENDTHFMRQFKKFVGVSPRQYKFAAASLHHI